MKSLVKIALIFRSDLAALIEANRRRNQSYVEDLLIEVQPKMA